MALEKITIKTLNEQLTNYITDTSTYLENQKNEFIRIQGLLLRSISTVNANISKLSTQYNKLANSEIADASLNTESLAQKCERQDKMIKFLLLTYEKQNQRINELTEALNKTILKSSLDASVANNNMLIVTNKLGDFEKSLNVIAQKTIDNVHDISTLKNQTQTKNGTLKKLLTELSDIVEHV